jgi:hypothetical protein
MSDWIMWLQIALLTARTPATLVVVGLGLLFAICRLLLDRSPSVFTRSKQFIVLTSYGSCISCCAYGALLVVVSLLEPPGEAKAWTQFFSEVAFGWCLFLALTTFVAIGLAFGGWPVPKGLRLTRFSIVHFACSVLVFFIATKGEGIW